MLDRAKPGHGDKSAWELDGDDINSDHFIANNCEHLMPIEERHAVCFTLNEHVCVRLNM